MNNSDQISIEEITVDPDDLYFEESFTDRKVATIQRLTPIKSDGSPDPSRPVLYTGKTQLMSQVGPVPVQCQIEATTLEEAVQKFPESVKQAIEKMLEEAKEMRRQSSSRIVVPGAQGGPIMPGSQGGNIISG